MELTPSDKVATYERKNRIEKGYFLGKLEEVKPRAKEDGTPIEGKFGKQAILIFGVYDKKTKLPIGIKKDNNETALVLPLVVYTEYKDDKTGGYRSALTANSRTTKTFTALGWTFGKEKLNTDNFIGKECELNIDDYDATDTDKDGKEVVYKASYIKDIGKLEEASASSNNTDKPLLLRKKEEMKELLEQELITPQSYEMAIKQLDEKLRRLG